jgi:hypothetical protein
VRIPEAPPEAGLLLLRRGLSKIEKRTPRKQNVSRFLLAFGSIEVAGMSATRLRTTRSAAGKGVGLICLARSPHTEAG